MGFVYVGGKTNQWRNGYMKIGETNQQYISTRVSQIRHSDGNFVLFKYLELPDSTPAITKAIEGHARMMLEREGWHNTHCDYFTAPINKDTREQVYRTFTESAINYMTEYCNMYGLTYIVKEGNPQTKKMVKHRDRA